MGERPLLLHARRSAARRRRAGGGAPEHDRADERAGERAGERTAEDEAARDALREAAGLPVDGVRGGWPRYLPRPSAADAAADTAGPLGGPEADPGWAARADPRLGPVAATRPDAPPGSPLGVPVLPMPPAFRDAPRGDEPVRPRAAAEALAAPGEARVRAVAAARSEAAAVGGEPVLVERLAETDTASAAAGEAAEPEPAEAAGDPLELGLRPLPLPTLDSSWPVAPELPADALALPRAPGQPATATEPGRPATRGAAGGPAAPGAGPPLNPAEAPAAREAERQARALAQRAYQELARAARQLQLGFVGRAADASVAMAQSHENAARTIEQRHAGDLAGVDGAAERARQDIDAAADLATLRLETAALNAGRAIEQAAGRAHGAINAGERRAGGQIEAVVGQLVGGHTRAYDGAISSAETALHEALDAMTNWVDGLPGEYGLGGEPMQAAKNESLRARIPRWVDPEKKRLQDRFDAKNKAWTQSRNSTACTLSCSYRDQLQRENARMARQSRQAVVRALRKARADLARQRHEGRRTLLEQQRAARRQLALQQQATRQRLIGQSRGLAAAVQGETRAALAGLAASARGALPTYWRSAQAFDQALRKAAAQSAAALRLTAERGPGGALAGLQPPGKALEARLAESRQRLQTTLGLRARMQAQAGEDVQARFAAALQLLGGQAGERLALGIDGLQRAFDSLAGSVGQAAEGWSQPLQRHMAAFIDRQRADARRQLSSLLDGSRPGTGGGRGGAEGGEAHGEAGAEAEAPQPDCSSCETAGGESGGEGGGAASAAPGAAAPQGLTAQIREEVQHAGARARPRSFFARQLTDSGQQFETQLNTRAVNVKSAFENAFAGTVNETGVLAALRGLSRLKGRALEEVAYPRAIAGRSLDADLRRFLGADSDDYRAARNYLRGNHLAAASYELRDSIGFFNDDERRIEEVMRALSPDELRGLVAADPGLRRAVGDALGGTDRQVFDALLAGDHALADAYRLRDEVDKARREGGNLGAVIERRTGAPEEGDWRAGMDVDADTRRREVVAALGGIVPAGDIADAAAPGGRRAMSAEERAIAYVTRDIEVEVGGGGEMPPQTITLRLEGANRDLAVALLRHGPNAIETRVARLGVELQRRGRPDPLELDRALYDERFMPDRSDASPEERETNERNRREARADRERTLLLAAQAYATEPDSSTPALDPEAVLRPDFRPDPARVRASRSALVLRLRDRFGSDTVGAELAEGLLTDLRPSAATVALALRHATLERSGTNEELLFRFTERMTRAEIADMRVEFRRQTGRELDAVLGTFEGGDVLPELSGDDRLRMERALRGVARTDRERLEAAAFALLQQRRETGAWGASLAQGTLADQTMSSYARELSLLAGGPIAFNRRGEVVSRLPNFRADGRYTGTDTDHFAGVVNTAQAVADSYAARVDAFADVLTTGIAIIGAIAAAVITVATGGLAAPLIAAALITGLASMATNYAIKGGRYGWEQAAVDLGMTVVQAVTAGVGATLGAAAQVASKGAQAATQLSRTVTLLSRIFTDNPLLNQIIVGAITGSIGGLGSAALNEQTWEQGNPVANLFLGFAKGLLSGAATAAVTNSIESIGIRGTAISQRLQNLAASGGLLRGGGAILLRGGARALIAGTGGMAGRTTEVLAEAAAGRFHGDAGDALHEIGKAGLHAAIQGFGEGGAEAVGQRTRNARVAAAAESINAERARAGLVPPLSGAPLHAAAEDLLLMDMASRRRSPEVRARNVAHVARHGGLRETVPTTTAAPRPVRPGAPAAEAGPVLRAGAAGEQLELFPGARRAAPEAEAGAQRAHAEALEAAAARIARAREQAGLPPLAPEALQAAAAAQVARPPAAARRHEEATPLRRPGPAETEAAVPPRQLELELGARREPPVRPAVGAAESSAGTAVPARARPAAEAEAAARPRGAEAEPATRARVAEPEAPARARAADAEAGAARRAQPATEGAAARVRGSGEMELAPRVQIKAAEAPAVTRQAVQEVLDLPGLAGLVRLHPAQPGEPTTVTLKRADGQELQVRIVVGTTEGGDIASFRRGGAGEEGIGFVVTLSNRARPGARARAIAHELAELRHHGLPSATRPDALAPGRGRLPGARLSPHDQGRLAELALLARRLETPGLPERARAQTQREAEALLGHLALLHAEDAVPRVRLAADALGEGSPARRLLEQTRERALRIGAEDLLHPAHAVDASRPMTPADHARLGRLAELAERAARPLPADAREGGAVEMRRRFRAELEHSGLLDTDAATTARLARVRAVLGEDSPAWRMIEEVRTRQTLPGQNDALRPGLAPDPRTVLSERDQARLGRLRGLLEDLRRPVAPGEADSPALRQRRHDAQELASEMGLLFGRHADARAALAERHLGGAQALVTQLRQLRRDGLANPLLLPLTGQAEDVPLLLRQVEAARAIGRLDDAARLMQIAGLHLEAAGWFGGARGDPVLAAALRTLPAESVALLGDMTRRRAATDASANLTREAATVRERIAALMRRRPADPSQQAELDRLGRRAAALDREAAAERRVATRPLDMGEGAARSFAGPDEAFGAIRRVATLPSLVRDARNAELVTRIHGDSPDFQPMRRMLETFHDLNRGRPGRAGEFEFEQRRREVLADWVRGNFVSRETGKVRALADIETIRAVPGERLELREPDGTRARLAGGARVDVATAGPEGGTAMRTMSVDEAVALRAQLRARLQAEGAAAPRSEAERNRIAHEINNLSEALGEAAGRRFAATLPGGEGKLIAARGAGVTDLLHIGPGGHVTVIECKGGDSPLGSRGATQGGRHVRAEQTTPEYLRSLAHRMLATHPEAANAILAALNATPPRISAVVVRQPFGADGNTPAPIEVTDYPVTRKGL